ncbi:MAG: four helix bundle protein [Victivallales bacterium]
MSNSEKYKESPLFIKTRDFIVWLFQCSSKFPKQYRQSLTLRIENAALDFQDIIGQVVITKEARQLNYVDIYLWKLRQLLRIAAELHILSGRQMIYAGERINELGRLSGGWKKSILNKR